MWATSAIEDADRLDRVEAVGVLRRALHMARDQKRHLLLALTFVLLSVLVTLAGPTIVRFAIDHGISEGNSAVLNVAVVSYVAVTIIGYFVGRFQFVELNRAV
jgi:ABC-type multidrug transport system fused ATPase/permease subunit